MYNLNPNSPWESVTNYIDPSLYAGEAIEHPFYIENAPYETPHRVVVDVYEWNLEEEFERLNIAVEKYPIIAVDTEFPGTVLKASQIPDGFNKKFNSTYYGVALTVNSSQLIQLGMTLYDPTGQSPKDVACWQFNFFFDEGYEACNVPSMRLLKSSGILLDEHLKLGIDPRRFAELFMKSSLCMNPFIEWITFHGATDMAYFLKVLLGGPVPYLLEEFLTILCRYFPCLFDLKHLLITLEDKRGGLGILATQAGIKRQGQQHQAGSDSILTGDLFMHYREKFYERECPTELGKLIPCTEIGYVQLGNFYTEE